MKRLLSAAAAILCAVGFVPLAHAQTTTVTASAIKMSGTNISAGTLTLVPVNTLGQPIPFVTGGGGINGPQAFSCAIASGALSGCVVPDAALTTPVNILYQAVVCKTSVTPSVCFSELIVGLTGTTWAFDQYAPPASTTNVQAVVASSGTSVPGSCVAPAFFTKTTDASLYYCHSGGFVAIASSGGGVSPGSPDTAINYTCSTALCGDSAFTYNASLHELTLNTFTVSNSGNPFGTTLADPSAGGMQIASAAFMNIFNSGAQGTQIQDTGGNSVEITSDGGFMLTSSGIGASVFLNNSGTQGTFIEDTSGMGISLYGGGFGTTFDDFLNLQGLVADYNNIPTVSNGIPAEYATIDLTAKHAAVATGTALYTVPLTGAGVYRISWNAKVTTASDISSVLGGTAGLQVTYTDADDSVAVTQHCNAGYNSTDAALNTTQSQISGTCTVNAADSSFLQFGFDYTSVQTSQAMDYSLHIKLEAN